MTQMRKSYERQLRENTQTDTHTHTDRHTHTQTDILIPCRSKKEVSIVKIGSYHLLINSFKGMVSMRKEPKYVF